MYIKINNFDLKITKVSNFKLFSYNLDELVPNPKVPKYFIENQNRWIDNPDHPVYRAALEFNFIGKTIVAFDKVLENCVQLENKEYINVSKFLKREYPDKTDEFLFLKFHVFEDIQDQSELVKNTFLTETLVYPIFNSLNVLRDGSDIHNATLRHIIHTGIEYQPFIIGGHQLVHPLDEYSACLETGISYLDWMNSKFTLDDMAHIIAIYRLNRIVQTHSDDARQIQEERKNKH